MKQAHTKGTVTRRRFMGDSAMAGLGGIIGLGVAPQFLRAEARGANERLTLAYIGVGGMARSHLDNGISLRGEGRANIAAVCEVDSDRLAQAKALVGDSCKTFSDYRELLEQKDIDAVFIGSPDHWHAMHTIHACEAGKHVYVEKPASCTPAGGRAMVEAARKNHRVVQVGSQGRSGGPTQVDAMAQKVNQLVSTAREAGMLIVHVPAETSGFYNYHPARRRVEQIAALTIEGNYPIEALETREAVLPPMPIANANCPGGGTSYAAWTRQHPAISIHDTDIISGDGRQLYSYLLGNGIDTLFYVGIHANTTLIERSYGMRQMSAWGMDCVLVRDLTDIMFDPEGAPRMPHELALKKVIEHLEKHLLPTVTSQQLAAALAKIKP